MSEWLLVRARSRRRYLEDEEEEAGFGRKGMEVVGEQLTGDWVGLRLADGGKTEGRRR